jgi:hypothetical protein
MSGPSMTSFTHPPLFSFLFSHLFPSSLATPLLSSSANDRSNDQRSRHYAATVCFTFIFIPDAPAGPRL